MPACRHPSSLSTSPTAVSFLFPVCRHPFSLPTSPTTVSNAVYQPADIHLACLHLQRQCRILNASLPASIQPTVISNLSVEFCIPTCRHLQLQCQFVSPACRFSFSLSVCEHLQLQCRVLYTSLLTSSTAVSNFACQPAYISNGSVEFCIPAC